MPNSTGIIIRKRNYTHTHVINSCLKQEFPKVFNGNSYNLYLWQLLIKLVCIQFKVKVVQERLLYKTCMFVCVGVIFQFTEDKFSNDSN